MLPNFNLVVQMNLEWISPMDSQHLSGYVEGPTVGPICEDAQEDNLLPLLH